MALQPRRRIRSPRSDSTAAPAVRRPRRRRSSARRRFGLRPQAPATPPAPPQPLEELEDRHARPAVHRPSDQPRLPGRRPSRRAAHLRRDQRPEHRHRSGRAGHGRRRAARRAVGSGARHHPARQQAWLHRSTGRSCASRRTTVLKTEEDERKALLRIAERRQPARHAAAAVELRQGRGSGHAAQVGQRADASADRRNVDARTNTLIVRDVPSQFPEITSLIDGIDRAQPQVEIEARIVQTNKNYARALGVQWGFGGRVDPALGNTTNLAFPNNGSLTGRTGATQGPATGSTTGQPTRGQPRRDRREQRGRPGAGFGQRRVQPRRRAVGAREQRQRPPAVDAARDDAEQRRRRDDAGRADPDSDRRRTTPSR